VALPPDTQSREEILARRRAAEEEALLREVDEAVRQDDLLTFGQRYGRPIAIGAGVLLLAFGGFLFWQSRQHAERENESNAVIAALDQSQAGNFPAAATGASALIGQSKDGPEASARMLAAGAAVEQGNFAEAKKQLEALATDANTPQAIRDMALVRLVALEYDALDKGQVISRLAPLAKPGNPWFGSAGELTAMAYLDQGKRAEAGKLFAAIAQDTTVTDPMRSRARQMAGVLGVDAIPDVDTFLKQQAERSNQAGGAAAAQPAA
jgi:hypothetical protein